MTISNELSSEIAVALVTAKGKQPAELNDLKEILLEVHSTLQKLTEESRNARALSRAAGANQSGGN
ncbi:MAG: hypothetical protein M3R68_03870 [Acidobacteriota bacterium]|jgi:hypothetical protein|nr:hypothetical protein [Acidobacteriota bacterium]